jgi:hypothetical protein
MRKVLSVLFALYLVLAIPVVLAQDDVEEIEEIEVVTDVSEAEDVFDSTDWPVLERGINVLTPRTLRKNSLMFLVEHRTRQEFDRNSFEDLAGFDAGGLKIGLGLRYSFTDDLETGFYRLNGTNEAFDTYEFDLKYWLLRQKKHGVDLAARGGATWFSQGKVEDASGYFGQLLLGGNLNKHFRIGTGLLAHSESSSELKTLSDEEYSVAVPVQFEARFNGRFAWLAEIVTPVAGFKAPHPVISTSLKIMTWRHSFNLVVSNSQYMSADGIVAGSHRSMKNIVVGFCITREFNF